VYVPTSEVIDVHKKNKNVFFGVLEMEKMVGLVKLKRAFFLLLKIFGLEYSKNDLHQLVN